MTTITETLVRNLRVKDMRDELPDNVFPMRMRIELRRSDADDPTLSDRDGRPMKPPYYPFTVQRSISMPYIKSTTVWFKNPAQFPSEDVADSEVFFEDLIDMTERMLEVIRDDDPSGPTRFYITELDLCEIPEEYAFADRRGHRNFKVDPNDLHLYDDHAPIGISYFKKRPVIPRKVRGKLNEEFEAFPGNVVKPLRLEHLKRVTAKSHRQGPETAGPYRCAKYFTETLAEKYQGPDNVYPREDIDTTNWSAIEDTLSTLANYVPPRLADGSGNPVDGLDGGGFLGFVEFDGHYDQPEESVIEDGNWKN